MAEQPNEETINKLLEELRSGEANRQIKAVETITELKTDNELIVSALKALAANDSDRPVSREARIVSREARKALVALGIEAPPVSEPSSLVASKKERSSKEETDFLIGFFGMLAVNFPLWIIYIITYTNSLSSFFPALVLLLNLGALVGFAFTRPKIALGILGAYFVALSIALTAGLFAAVICFGSYL
ncbi:MAG: hypothetical protein HYZ49_06205 [Chloroflexi bacterium]|nr:hypothetical protein [Chloroflexota bacterium]